MWKTNNERTEIRDLGLYGPQSFLKRVNKRKTHTYTYRERERERERERKRERERD